MIYHSRTNYILVKIY